MCTYKLTTTQLVCGLSHTTQIDPPVCPGVILAVFFSYFFPDWQLTTEKGCTSKETVLKRCLCFVSILSNKCHSQLLMMYEDHQVLS